MKKYLSAIFALLLSAVMSLSIINTACFAASKPDACNMDPSFSELCDQHGEDDLMKTVGNVLNAIYGIIAVIAVVMIVIAGIKYSTSQGDPGKVQSAKGTILYAIIGLVITISAFAITNFILSALK
jgi:hypothetical protein